MTTKRPKPSLASAVALIEERGCVAVFPDTARKSSPWVSLWELYYPRSPFRWNWEEGADPRVVRLWWLKDELARSKRVVYGRFFGNRPVFLSLGEAAKIVKNHPQPQSLSALARECLSQLEDNSPLTKRMISRELRKSGYEFSRSEIDRALLDLQKSFRIVSLGDSEREAGPMPSSEYAATALVFPQLVNGQTSF